MTTYRNAVIALFSARWIVPERNDNLRYIWNVDSQQLGIKTSTSDGFIICTIYKDGSWTSQIELSLTDLKLKINNCVTSYQLENVPAEEEKVWLLEKAEENFIISCNLVEVGRINYVDSSPECFLTEPNNIEFNIGGGDSATKEFMVGVPISEDTSSTTVTDKMDQDNVNHDTGATTNLDPDTVVTPNVNQDAGERQLKIVFNFSP